MKLNKMILNTAAITFAVVIMTGCSALKETFASQMEVPTLENQANRVAIGMAIVRENNIIENKMAISSDAQWPKLISADINSSKKQFISEALKNDPFYATVHYTKGIQRKLLGSGSLMNQLGSFGNLTAQIFDQSVSPLAYEAMNKLDLLYANPDLKPLNTYKSKSAYIADRIKNWPKIFKFDSMSGDFLEFKTGKLLEVEAASSDVHDNIHKAVISLSPVNLQKDLESAQEENEESNSNVIELEDEKARIETQIESKKAEDGKRSLTKEELASLNEELELKSEELKAAESVADEKEAIYFELLDQVVVALESDVNTDDENYINLAKNINIVSNEIQESATEAYTAFGIALTNIAANNILQKLSKELDSLARAKNYIPAHLQQKYDRRIARIVKNSLELLPNIAMGTYYAHKQSNIAEKYEDITDQILEIYNTKLEQEKAAAEAEADAKAEAEKLAAEQAELVSK